MGFLEIFNFNLEKKPAPFYQKEVLQDLGVVPGAVVIPRCDWVSCLTSFVFECVA